MAIVIGVDVENSFATHRIIYSTNSTKISLILSEENKVLD